MIIKEITEEPTSQLASLATTSFYDVSLTCLHVYIVVSCPVNVLLLLLNPLTILLLNNKASFRWRYIDKARTSLQLEGRGLRSILAASLVIARLWTLA